MARIQNENQANLRERKLRNNECFLLTNAQSVIDYSVFNYLLYNIFIHFQKIISNCTYISKKPINH